MQRPTTIILMALGLAAVVRRRPLENNSERPGSRLVWHFMRRGQPARFQRYLSFLASRSPKALSAAAKRSTFVYCEDEPGSRAAAKLLTRDQARRIAARHREAAPFHRNVSEIVDLNY